MIGKKVRELRIKKGLTQEALANKLFVSPQAVSKWEKSISFPEISLLIPLADILGVTVDTLLRDSENNSIFDNPSQFFEIKITKPIESCVIHGTIKNISDYTFKKIRYKAKFKDSSGNMLDYFINSLSAFAPQDIKHVSLLSSSDSENIDTIELEVLEFTLN